MAKHAATPGSGLTLEEMDLTVDPSKDFYRFVNGGWADANPVPPDEASWGVFQEVRRRNELVLKEILEASAAAPKDDLHRKLGDYFASGMDEPAIEAAGAKPIEPELARIEALADAKDLPALLAHLHAIGVSAFFRASARADLTDSSTNILFVTQDGLGLPEKDYYLRTDADSAKLREKYVAHVSRVFALLGEAPNDAGASAATVLDIETELAKTVLGAVELRDPKKTLNKITVADAQKLTPHLDWTAYLAAQGLDPAGPVNLVAPQHFEHVDALLAGRPLADWKTYLRWHLARAQANYLGPKFETEAFDFYGRTLGGSKEQRPRWKRVVEATGGAMGEALGQAYVEKTFSPKAKERCQRMVDDLLAAMKVRLEHLEWMSDATRARALEKLAAFATKIGYPDTWRDWSGLVVERGAYAANRMRAAEFNYRYDLAKVGKPVDKKEFGIPAFVVNAGYNPAKNDITFPAGILQPPFFGEAYDDALNYGAMGAAIGHEITHGFDDKGSQFDAQGNLANWWTDADRAEFERRTKVVEEQFSGYEAVPGLRVNGKLTLGENLADLAGLTIAYDALAQRLKEHPSGPIDGFTPEQRFFIAWARAWRSNDTPERLKLQVNTNPHSPGRFRSVGPLSNMDAFQAAYGFEDADPVMRPRAARAIVW